MIRSLFANSALVLRLARRDVEQKYRGSQLGLLWAFINPLMMLALYTFVFGSVFKARWSIGSGSTGEYAVILFAGLILHTFAADVLSRSPSLVTANANFVRKIIFPLEILPVVAVLSSVFQLLINFAVLLAGIFLVFGAVPIYALLLPLILLPYIIITLGASWLLSSLGVYLRDIGQVISLFVTILLFASPVLYPAEMLPEKWRWVLYANPLTIPVQDTRNLLMGNTLPNFASLFAYTAISLAIALTGFAWFQKTRKGFADVI